MPVDYLGRPYFDSWAQTDFSTYIEAGWMTLEEVANAKARAVDAAHGEPPTAMTLQQVLQEDHDHAFRFDGDIDTAPAFSVGQRVVTAKHGHAGHTRLPQYARGRTGTIQAYNGAHIFPDLSARGTELHQHCYNVMFDAAELWPEASGSKDKVCLDLWESYLGGA
jgi:nitrile hydratase